MRSLFSILTAGGLMMLSSPTQAAQMPPNRVHEAVETLREIHAVPDKDVPQDLWEKADCVIVVPNVKKAAFIVGGEFGKGLMSCRQNGAWSAPVFMELEKGSWGAQIGAQNIDLVMLVMNREGTAKLLNNKVSLGAEASIAAGPVGRDARAATDAQMHAEILSYSRTQGVFAGIDLSGGVLKPDNDMNKHYYGSKTPKDVALGTGVAVPADLRQFTGALNREGVATTGKK
jgi:lipid-binding SYLF domain-containing protein